MQYSQEHLKTMVYAEFGGQTECVMGNWKIENKRNCVHNAVTLWYPERVPSISASLEWPAYIDSLWQLTFCSFVSFFFLIVYTGWRMAIFLRKATKGLMIK